MIIIGSQAYPKLLENSWHQNSCDIDVLMSAEELDAYIRMEQCFNPECLVKERTDDYCCIANTSGFDYVEIYIGHSNNSTEQLLTYCNNKHLEPVEANINVLLGIKESHKYKRNSPHFMKTMRDIQQLREDGAVLTDPELIRIVELRSKETYNYAHPVLNQPKSTFFVDEGIYQYDHDSIHEVVSVRDEPAYKSYMQPGAEVMTSKGRFFALDERTRILGVYEEACVLALERSQIPYKFAPQPETSFITALTKVCTSITSGWFREYAYNHFDAVISLYRSLGPEDYINRFRNNIHMVKPFKEE